MINPSKTSTPDDRVHWADAARGFGISLVVVGHVWRGLEKAAIIPANAVFFAVDRAIYSFHMPLLFFISGLFFYPSIARHTTFDFVVARFARLIWPLIIWM